MICHGENGSRMEKILKTNYLRKVNAKVHLKERPADIFQ